MPATTDTGKKLQPGEQNGYKLKRPYDCDDVTEGAKKDNVTLSDAKTACGKGCWKVALFIAPPGDVGKDGDFHWYRQDDDGSWSHKMDSMDPSQEDNAGKKISDPEKADTGPYKLCRYFCVCPDEVKKKVTVAMAGPYAGPEFAIRIPAVTGIFTSGADNPQWSLSPAELIEIRARLEDLPPAEAPAQPRLGQKGYFVDTGIRVFQVYGGVVSSGTEHYQDARRAAPWLDDLRKRKIQEQEKEEAMTDVKIGGRGAVSGTDKALEVLKAGVHSGCIQGDGHSALMSGLGRIDQALAGGGNSGISIACEGFLLAVRRHMGTTISLNAANEFFEVVTQIRQPFSSPAEMYVDAIPFVRDFQRIETACNLTVSLPHRLPPDRAAVAVSRNALLELIGAWELPAESRAELEELIQGMARLASGEEPANDIIGSELLTQFGGLCTALEDRSLSRTQANYLRGYVVFAGIGSLCPLPGWWKLTQLAVLIPIAIYVVVSGIRSSASHAKVKKAAEVIDEYIHDDPPHTRVKVREKAREAAKELTPEQKRELKKILQEALDKSQNLDPKEKILMQQAIDELASEDEEEK